MNRLDAVLNRIRVSFSVEKILDMIPVAVGASRDTSDIVPHNNNDLHLWHPIALNHLYAMVGNIFVVFSGQFDYRFVVLDIIALAFGAIRDTSNIVREDNHRPHNNNDLHLTLSHPRWNDCLFFTA